MRVIDSWTGARADALRRAYRMTIEDFAEKLGLSTRAVAYWRERPGTVQRPERQRMLDTALERAPDAVKARFTMLVSQDGSRSATNGNVAAQQPGDADFLALTQPPTDLSNASISDARSVIEWVESTNTSDDIIGYFAQTITAVAEEHAARPPAALLVKVRQLHAMVQTLLRGGRQRSRQARELLRLDADLLAHLCQLLGDIHYDQAASAYAMASVVLADEAGTGSAAAFSARSQLARWRGHYAEAADLAACGLECNPQPTLRTLLAYQEADAAAASGQMAHRAVLTLQTADAMDDGATVYSVWSCPPARRALFRMGVALNLGDPREALRQADETEPMWEHERPLAFGTWAHFQIAAAKAHIMLGSADGAMHQVAPVLDLPREYRISTLTGHLATLDALMQDKRFAESRQVASLREQIGRFTERPADEASKEDE